MTKAGGTVSYISNAKNNFLRHPVRNMGNEAY